MEANMAPQPHPKQFALFTAKKRIADKIEALIALLDAIDGDTDLEDFLEGDETEDLEPEEDKAADDEPCDCDPNQPAGGDLGWPESNAYWGVSEFSPISFAAE